MTWLGVDVSKGSYEASAYEAPASRSFRGGQALPRLVRWLQEHAEPHVVLEATGGYERELCELLAARQIRFSVVNPYHARAFMRSTGKRAKTDRIDAQQLAQMGAALKLKPSELRSRELVKLQSLVLRRHQLTEQLVAVRNHAEHAQEPLVRASVKRTTQFLRKELQRLETALKQLLDSSVELSAATRRLQTVKGVGPVVAAGLLVHLPELGRLSRGEAAALAGLAPYNMDSGAYRGRRTIRGGRAPLRNLLYMAALVASRHNPPLRAYYQRMLRRGKEKKVALIAIARKLVVTLNAMLKHGQDWQPDPHELPSSP